MTVGIVGLGLIGGSIGLALRQPGRTILGFDPNPEAQAVALKRQCIDELRDLAEVCRADAVFVAVPPKAVVSVLAEVSRFRGPETVYTDCTGVKEAVTAWDDGARDPHFVSGHPMAGHERGGAEYASAWLFRGAKWILMPTSWTGAETPLKIGALIQETGAAPARLDARVHDAQLALLSHLPHAIAAALVLTADQYKAAAVGGPSWRDLTRVGGVDPELWTQIMNGNRAELIAAMDAFGTHLAELRRLLDAGDDKALKQWLGKAQEAKRLAPDSEPKPKRVLPKKGRRP